MNDAIASDSRLISSRYPGMNPTLSPGCGSVGRYEFAQLAPTHFVPSRLVRYRSSRTKLGSEPHLAALHFFVYDVEFEKLWRSPDAWRQFSKWGAVLSPDFSMYPQWPKWKRIFNHGRKMELSRHWQRNGVVVIPTINFAKLTDFDWCLDGMMKGGAIAISSVGSRTEREWEVWVAGVEESLACLQPTALLIYGSDRHLPPGVRKMPDLEVKVYRSDWKRH